MAWVGGAAHQYSQCVEGMTKGGTCWLQWHWSDDNYARAASLLLHYIPVFTLESFMRSDRRSAQGLTPQDRDSAQAFPDADSESIVLSRLIQTIPACALTRTHNLSGLRPHCVVVVPSVYNVEIENTRGVG